jgi:hypothetical protein
MVSCLLISSLPVSGCGNPAEGTVKIAPEARRRSADPVYKVRPGVRASKPNGPAADVPGVPGKQSPGRWRGLD